MINHSLKEQLRKLEESLLQPNVRRSEEELSRLLSDDFIEFGSSGKVYNKQQVIEALLKESSGQISIMEFDLAVLSSDVVLITYRAAKESSSAEGNISYSLRSSIWKFLDGRWQITFHQGTPA